MPIDVDRTLNAESGTQLVIIGFPDGAPTTGEFSFHLNFHVPPGTTSVATKPIIAGLVELIDGSVFYPPILPCVEDMADAPTVTIPLTGNSLTLPELTDDLGCDAVTYNFLPGTAPTATAPGTGTPPAPTGTSSPTATPTPTSTATGFGGRRACARDPDALARRRGAPRAAPRRARTAAGGSTGRLRPRVGIAGDRP